MALSRNILLGYPNRANGASISGGAWSAQLPAANLLDRRLAKVARSANVAPLSTRFNVDLGAIRKVQIVNLTNHNFSLTAMYRIVGSDSAAFDALLYDSNWLPVWPEVYPYGTLEWEDDNFWSGQYAAEEIEGTTTALTHVLPITTLARYWRIELSDPSNPAGYVQAGRLFIGPAWQPTRNKSYGWTMAWENETGVAASRSGAEFFDRRKPFRVVKFSLDWLSMDETLAKGFELLRRAGIDEEIMFIRDPTDTMHAIRSQFLCRIRTPNPIENPSYATGKMSLELKELQ